MDEKNEKEKVNEEKEELLKERVFFYFAQLCRIPRQSGNEKAVSDFILNWALDQGLKAKQDAVNNVFIRKAASAGYEAAPPVMLQAHMDMVCEKNEGVIHDFTKDPIKWMIEGDLISTGGETTLGADNGIGVACAMAVLEDKTLAHPRLEVLFTVAEESDFTGAANFDTSWMESDRMINLDHASDKEILCGSCGGMDAVITLPIKPEKLKTGWKTCTVRIYGLKGGHSGEDIHRGRGNANLLLGRFLAAAEKRFAYGISAAGGGTCRLAIPREAKADISLGEADIKELQKLAEELQEMFRNELQATSSSLCISVTEAPAAEFLVAPEKIINLILLAPDGICQMNEMLTGLVDTSDNMGELHMDSESFQLVFEIRSAKDSLKYFVYDKISRLAKLLGADCTTTLEYGSWQFRPQSKFRDKAIEVFKKTYGTEPAVLTLHAGLEVGYFFDARPSLDAIALGPDCWNFHSPSECVGISSVRRFYKYLCTLLAELY